MKESYRKGVANHLTLSLAAAVVRPQSKRRREASVGWVWSFENELWDADPVDRRGRQYACQRQREVASDPT
jgi:hypothetical protein